MEHEYQPQFGNVRDNESAFHVAMYEIEHGDSASGRKILEALRAHILGTGELKSRIHILPHVEDVLRSLKDDEREDETWLKNHSMEFPRA